MRLALFTCALLVAPALADDTPVRPDSKAPAKDEAIEKEITGAKAEYSDALKKAKADLANAFDTAREKIASSTTIAGAQKIGRLETLAKEKTAFETNDYLPRSSQMQPAVQLFQQALGKTRQAFGKSVESAAKSYLDRKELANYEAVLKDKQAFLEQTTLEAKELLRVALTGSVWQWGTDGDLVFRKDGYVGHKGWEAGGLVTRWEVLDRRTVMLEIERGREKNIHEILVFSESIGEYTAFGFGNTIGNKTEPKKRRR